LYEETKPELDKNFIDVKGLKPGELYEFVVVAVDGNTMKESDIAEIEASSTGTFLMLNPYFIIFYLMYLINIHQITVNN